MPRTINDQLVNKFKCLANLPASNLDSFLRHVQTIKAKLQLNDEELEDFVNGLLFNLSVNPKSCPNKQNNDKDIVELTKLLLQQSSDAFCVKGSDFTYICANEKFIEMSKLQAEKNIINRSDCELPWQDGVSFFRRLDKQVLEGKSYKTLMPVEIATGEQIVVLEEKYPLFGPNREIQGIILKLEQIKDLNKVKPFISLCENDFIIPDLTNYLSQRYLIQEVYCSYITKEESNCLFYAMRGKTAKEIAKKLDKSPKTVESHLEHIRIKLNCISKSELISKSIEYGFMSIIPEGILKIHFSEKF